MVECPQINNHNTVFGSKGSAICAQAVYFLHSTRPSVTWLMLMVIGCLRLSDVSFICLVVNPRRTSQEISGGFLYGVYMSSKLLWIDSNGKIETINPVKSYFGSEFPAICNHCGVMMWQGVKNFFEKFLLLLKMTDP